MICTDALVQPVRDSVVLDDERRVSIRHVCSMEATSQPLDRLGSLAWGAVIDDISTGGLGITLCYPFPPGTYLAVDVHGANGMLRTVLVRVVHVRDRSDGVWQLGCEFVKPMSASDLDMLI